MFARGVAMFCVLVSVVSLASAAPSDLPGPWNAGGLVLETRSVSASARLARNPDDPSEVQLERGVQFWLECKCDPSLSAFYLEKCVLTSLTDAEGRDLMGGAVSQKRHAAGFSRMSFVKHARDFISTRGDQRAVNVNLSAMKLSEFPEVIGQFTAEVDVVAGDLVPSDQIVLKTMDEHVEIAPGVRVLLSRVEQVDGKITLDYEYVVSRENEYENETISAPIVVGLVLRRKGGVVQSVISPSDEIETRDAYIGAAKGFQIDAGYLDLLESIEFAVMTDVRRVRFDVRGEGIRFVSDD